VVNYPSLKEVRRDKIYNFLRGEEWRGDNFQYNLKIGTREPKDVRTARLSNGTGLGEGESTSSHTERNLTAGMPRGAPVDTTICSGNWGPRK